MAFQRWVLIALIIGFPVWIIFAYIYEWTPEGLRQTVDEENEQAIPSSSGKNSTRYIIFGLSLTLVLLLADKIFNLTPHRPENARSNKIAIIPLTNLNSKDENLEYFSDGVSNEIIDELAQIKSLVITAFTSSMLYKNTSKSHLEIAEELNVDYLISGTSRVYSSGDSVKLSLELIDPNLNNKRVWNGTYSEKMDNAPKIQMSIAKQVASSLNLTLSPEEKVSLEKPNTTSGEAFRLFLLARSEFMKLNRDGFKTSIEAAKKAIELDSKYAQAYTWLAWAYQLSSNPWFDGHYNRTISELDALVTPLIEKSMELDPSSSDVFLVRGHQRVFIESLLRDGKKDVEYALEINSWPLVPTTYCICVVISTYVALDELSKATDLVTLTRKVDPGSVFNAWDGANLLTKEEKYKEAQILYEEAARIAPVSMFNTFLGWNYYHNGEYKKALTQLSNTYNESDLPTTLNVAYLSNTYFKLGDMIRSEFYLQELIDRDIAGEHHINLYISLVYAARGDKDNAMQFLAKAMDRRNWGIAFLTNVDPIFKPFYNDPTFKKIRMQMQYYE
jgi:TolB-like protein/Tfp pilus assembly protein PilF